MLVMLNKISDEHFRLLGTNGYHFYKKKNKTKKNKKKNEWLSFKGKELKIYYCELALSSEAQI